MKVVKTAQFKAAQVNEGWYWATDKVFAPGHLIICGDWQKPATDPKEYPSAPLWPALEGVFERQRAKKYPDRPSRIGALYVAKGLQSAREWKKLLHKPYLYNIEIITGTPYLTDGSSWSDAHHNASKPWYMDGKKPEDVAKSMDDQTHPLMSHLDYKADQYWNGGTSYDGQELEIPEYLLGKGSQVRIVNRIE